MYGTLDLFCGAGGMSLGFSNNSSYNIICGVDSWDDAIETYRHNHQSVGLVYDMAQKDPSELPVSKNQVDVIVGGPPCKGFSIAGERDPDDERNQLVPRFIDYVRYYEPKVAVMENVVGILSMENGDVIDYIYDKYEEIGYNINHKKLKAEMFGIPQRRHRIFFIATKSQTIKFPTTNKKKKTAREALKNIDKQHPDHQETNHSDDMVDRISALEYEESLYDNYTEAWKRIHPDKPAPTIKENHGAPFIHYEKDRVGTPRECAKIQTFPQSFRFKGSKSSKLKQIGNAVPPKLAEEVADKIQTEIL